MSAPPFHVIVHRRLSREPGDWRIGPFESSFEQAVAAIEALPRLFVEPDGSFVWVSADDRHPWQLDGVLYDAHGQLMHLELKGDCTVAAYETLLSALGWTANDLGFHVSGEGRWLTESEFRHQYLTAAKS